jgi:lipopolysaccharide/colanic/teichoic acid biosynthesis glycosyltransferase
VDGSHAAPDGTAFHGSQETPVQVLERLRAGSDHIPLRMIQDDPRLIDPSLYISTWSPRYRVLKRLFDVAISVLAGVVVLPGIPVVALIIRMDSPGPALYQQTRIGQHGKRFQIYKFRSMRTDAEAKGAVYASENDPRVTRFGRFLRRTRIDEVPQIWNVLRGDMSLIGPRPERPENEQMLTDALPGFALRTLVKPGLTGWAQTLAPYANTVEQTGKKLEYDLYYVRNASMAMDLRISLRTMRVMLGLKGQ